VEKWLNKLEPALVGAHPNVEERVGRKHR
jgi:hypothetical protein